jgi:hypothetical protein
VTDPVLYLATEIASGELTERTGRRRARIQSRLLSV